MYACIYIPDFPLQAIARHEPTLRSRATAIVEGTPPLCTVITVNSPAREAGVALGMTRIEATQFPSLAVRHRSPEQEAAAHAALLDLGLSVSPRVEDIALDTAVLDLAGLEHLFGSPETIARRLAQRAEGLGFEPHVAAASSPDAAIHAARGFRGVTFIPAGKEAERLDSLPVDVLAPSQEICETLGRWGVRTFQALAALPTVALAERLGQEGVHLQKLARGHTHRTLVPVEAAPRFEEVQELEYPVTLLEPLAFILGELLNQLCTRLKARALATQELHLKLELEAGIEVEPEVEIGNSKLATRPDRESLQCRTLQLPVPTQDSQLLLKLWLLNLKSEPPRAPISKVTLAAEPVKPRVAQGGLFLPLAPDPEKLEVTLARITGVIGKEKLGSPEPVDTHRPGAFRMKRFAPGVGLHKTDGRRSTTRRPSSVIRCEPQPTTALRVFRPPLPATVETRAGRPVRVFAFGVHGDVVAAAGPWRTSGDWWRDDAWSRDEWDVELFKGHGQPTKLYRIYCDLATGDWFIRGTYD